MLQALCSKWWCLALRGLCAIVAGAVSIAHPELTIFILVILVGASALVDGLACVFMGMGGGGEGRPWWEMILLGLLGVGFGIATFVMPGLTAVVLLSLVAGWSIARGVVEIIAAIRLRKAIEGEWLLALSGVISVGFGVLLIAKPFEGLAAIGMVIGVFLCLFGAMAVALSLRLRGLQKHLSHA